MTPLTKMYTLGHNFIPPSIHAGGLRYHGDAPIISMLTKEGLMEARAYYQREVFEAALLFAKTKGFIPASETNHTIKATTEKAVMAREEGKERVILFNFSGHGLLDLSAYDAFLRGRTPGPRTQRRGDKKGLNPRGKTGLKIKAHSLTIGVPH